MSMLMMILNTRFSRLKREFAFLLLFTTTIASFARGENFKCPTYAFEKSPFLLSELNPQASMLEGVSQPHDRSVLYRGITPNRGQFDLEKALRGMLGLKATVGSPMHWLITQVLTGQKKLSDRMFPKTSLNLKVEKYLYDRKILADVQALLDCAGGNFYDASVAEDYASDLMDKFFFRFGGSKIKKYDFDLADPFYYRSDTQARGFGNNSINYVISSVYDQIAAIYGEKILVLQETSGRSFDLCYWNWVHNRELCDNWVDDGEIDIAGYVTQANIIGYQSRKVTRKGRGIWGKILYPNPIDAAYYRFELDGEKDVLVLDTEDALCVSLASDALYHRCAVHNSQLIKRRLAPLPSQSILPEVVPLMGVIASSKAQAEKIFRKYSVLSARPITDEAKEALEGLHHSETKFQYYSVSGSGISGVEREKSPPMVSEPDLEDINP